MGVVNAGGVSEEMYGYLAGILLSIVPIMGADLHNLVRNIAHSAEPNNDIHIVHGLHYSYGDMYPHFNIRIHNHGVPSAVLNHVYVYHDGYMWLFYVIT